MVIQLERFQKFNLQILNNKIDFDASNVKDSNFENCIIGPDSYLDWNFVL
jgi:hypothetical protein